MARSGTVLSSVPEGEIEDEEEIIDDAALEEEEVEAAENARLEAEARKGGWRPLAEYTGRPGGWVDAKTFLQRGEEFAPFVKKQRDELRIERAALVEETTALRTELVTTRKEMQQLLEFSRKSDQAGYDRAVRELKQRQREAVAAGDTVAYDAVEAQLDQMEEARESAQPAAEEIVEPKPAAKIDPVIQQWIGENPWFNSDQFLAGQMINEHKVVLNESPGMPLAEQLDVAKEALMRRFPKKFGIQEKPEMTRTRTPAAPLAPTPPSTRPRGRTGIDAIADPTDRAQAREGFRRAQRNVPGVTEEEFLRIWYDSHADVLQVMDETKTAKRHRTHGR